jgi:hypothetical protein
VRSNRHIPFKRLRYTSREKTERERGREGKKEGGRKREEKVRVSIAHRAQAKCLIIADKAPHDLCPHDSSFPVPHGALCPSQNKLYLVL